jgi:hypothetical protein
MYDEGMTDTTAPMFREIITSADGTVTEGQCGEEHALSLLRTAVRRGYRVLATRQGGAVIVRDVWTAATVPAKRTVELIPSLPCGTLTATVRRDLDMITRARAPHLRDGRIRAGYFYAVPPAATARLIARGLVTGGETEGRPITVSLAARLAMLAGDHQTRTSKPRGYYRDPDHIGPWRKGGCMHDRSSAASCSCGGFSTWAEDRDSARQKAREHRQEATAALVSEMACTVRSAA